MDEDAPRPAPDGLPAAVLPPSAALPPFPGGGVPNLSAAIRAARGEAAERARALGDITDAKLARLELLREFLEPVLAQVPPEVDLFDMGVVPGEHPRLFVDMVAFVEMGRDRRHYRFLQDRRHGRVLIHEGDSVTATVAAVTAYMARRLVEREQILAMEDRGEVLPPAVPASAVPERRRARPLRLVLGTLRLVLDGFGMAAVGALVWFGLRSLHVHLPVWNP